MNVTKLILWNLWVVKTKIIMADLSLYSVQIPYCWVCHDATVAVLVA